MSGKERNWLHGAARAEPMPLAEALPDDDPGAEPGEDVHPSRAYGGLWSRRDRAHMVEFRLGDPDQPDESFDYNYLPRLSWHPGRGEIVLFFDAVGFHVLIRGLNLGELKERLRQHLVTWVQNQGNDPVAIKQAQQEARAEGRDLVYVQEIRILPQKPQPEVPY